MSFHGHEDCRTEGGGSFFNGWKARCDRPSAMLGGAAGSLRKPRG
jgi:hypothetical protein